MRVTSHHVTPVVLGGAGLTRSRALQSHVELLVLNRVWTCNERRKEESACYQRAVKGLLILDTAEYLQQTIWLINAMRNLGKKGISFMDVGQRAAYPRTHTNTNTVL